MTEITARAERAATVETEPRLTLTELQSLLRDAAALERAQRPIVLPTAAPAVPTPVTLPTVAGHAPPRHPGLDITIPAPPEAGVGWAVLRHRAQQAPGWGVRAACVSMLLCLAGAATAGATDGNGGAVAVTAAGLLGVVGGIAQAVNEHGKEA